MSFRVLTLLEISELLRRWQVDQRVRRIARETGVDRKTVQRYLHQAVLLGLPRDRPLTARDVGAIAHCVQARPALEPSRSWEAIFPHRDRIRGWLRREEPLKLSDVHALLKREGVETSYATLRRFAIAELGWHRRERRRRTEPMTPGALAQVDFGKVGVMADALTGRKRVLSALVVTLCFSTYQFVWPLFEHSTEAVCEGLDEAWRFFEGTPRTLCPNNTRAIIDAADRRAPRVADAFADYALARGLLVDLLRLRRAREAPRVESHLQAVREGWFLPASFTLLEDAREGARRWARDVAGARLHPSALRPARELYEAEEKAHMAPLPSAPFDVPCWVDTTVRVDLHVQFQRALYSVPAGCGAQRVRVRADRTTVQIYRGTQLIKTHLRQPPGGRSTDPGDFLTLDLERDASRRAG